MTTLFAPMQLVFSARNPWLWIATSVLLAALANGLAWRYSPKTSGIRPIARWSFAPLYQTGRFLYYIGLPYVALLSGLISGTQLGLFDLAWLRDLTLALPAGLGALLTLLLIRALAFWREKTVPGGIISGEPGGSFLITLRESTYQEIHWAFYRSAPLLALEDRAQGIALGLSIVALEAWLNPAWRERWQQPHLATGAFRAASLTVLMAVIFGLTGNLWVTWGVHIAVESVGRWAWVRMEDAFAAAE